MSAKDMFLKLISVKGMGCKLALPILATGSVSGIVDAIEREKKIKGGSRKKKIALIESMNPQWKDLFSELGV